MPNPKVGSDRDLMAPKGNASPHNTFKSGMPLDHPAIKPNSNFRQRPRGSSEVPIPGELHLP